MATDREDTYGKLSGSLSVGHHPLTLLRLLPSEGLDLTLLQWNAAMAKSKSQIPRYVWHDDVHRHWLRESLCYFRLSFTPTYDQDQIVSTLDDYLRQSRISSYRRYEIYGGSDILLRMWIPSTLNFDNLCPELEALFRPYHLHQMHPFFVTDTFYHWLWKDRSNPTCFLHPELADFPDIGLIQAVNSGSRDRKLIDQAVSGSLLRRYPDETGIRFFLFLPGVLGSLDVEKTKALVRSLVNDYSRSRYIKDLAVYLGYGMNQVLIKAKVRHEDYEKISTHFLDHINKQGLEHNVKTETMLVTGGGKKSFFQTEHLRIESRSGKPPSVTKQPVVYLEAKEGPNFEAKASVRTDLERYFKGGGELYASKKVAKEGVLRATAALLNSSGGEVVVGLLEKSRFKSSLDKLTEFPGGEEYVAIGIEIEKGFRDWDTYQRQLTDLIKSHVRGRLNPMHWIEIKPVEIGSRTLAVLQIEHPPPDELFDIDNQIPVREGNRTISLDVSKIDEYKEIRRKKYFGE